MILVKAFFLKHRFVPYEGEELISSLLKYVHTQVRTSYFLGQELLEECMKDALSQVLNRIMGKMWTKPSGPWFSSLFL